MKVYLHNTGCRLNQSETETIGRQLITRGHEIVADAVTADTVVINTCAVTAEAARDARNLTRRLHRQNEAAGIVLTGCYATVAPADLARLPGVARVVDNTQKDNLVALLDPGGNDDALVYDREPLLRESLHGSFGRTRAFIKVQDGCDNRCTFCITTIARGAGVSRSLGDIVTEIQACAAAGYQEAVLTGVHLGSYGRDLGQATGLRDLVSAILTRTDIPRLRLSSLEPWDIPDGFFELWTSPRLLPHLHLPLQAGCDATLRRMARRTTSAGYEELVQAARAAVPDLHVSTDIIVGFPGETAADFAESLATVESLGFGRLHVFPYSPRPGTAAAQMPGQVRGPEKKARVRQMIALGQQLSLRFHQHYSGQTRRVLWEATTGASRRGLRWAGYTDNYIRVTAEGPADLLNRVTPALLVEPTAEGMSARPVSG